ncbi:MAG TPA: hypothetical protein PLN30_11075, partial [Ferruginibacter sp.]|nr:hypothetical protein [Ferruginibacter sp.]
GVTFVKNSSGKITHAKLSVKHHRKLIEDMIDHEHIQKGMQDEFVPWETTRAKILKKNKSGR